MRHDRRLLDALEARHLAVARRTAESTVPKVQSLLLMVAWVETPGGNLRAVVLGCRIHACVDDSPVASHDRGRGIVYEL